MTQSRTPDMTRPPLFPGFDGLMTLSRREGVDIRPTLLRVLTDLYVQASAHSDDEARQFVAALPLKPPSEAQLRMASNLSMQPKDAAEINDMFFRANASERVLILH